MIVLRVASGIHSHLATRLSEWVLAIYMSAIGWQLLRAGDSFHSVRGYHVLANHVTENTWGHTAVGISAVWLIALFLNGTFRWFRRISPWARWASGICVFLYCGLTACAFAMGNPIGPGVIDNTALAALAFAHSIIIAREVGAADKEAQRCRTRRLTVG